MADQVYYTGGMPHVSVTRAADFRLQTFSEQVRSSTIENESLTDTTITGADGGGGGGGGVEQPARRFNALR